ncbi:MAG: 2OG-Fe(II) oxygenase [Bacteroidetes bacterium]|nr:2OG-Fe(II) oxygenase [Bacteroidota bacterium]
MKNIINPSYLSEEKIKEIRKQFETASPCKHVALPNFLLSNVADTLYQNFPKLETLNVKRKSINENKSEEYHLDRYHSQFNELRDFLNSAEMYTWISKVTGIEGLSSTYDSLGSGIHQGGPGSFVDVHVDINMNPAAKLHRRINLLIYLNKNWKDEYGGALEFWDKDVKNCISKVMPYFNQAAIMVTDETSYHGYSKINIPDDESRKSFYIYYYTPAGKDFVYRDSRFKTRPDESMTKTAITEVKETLKINIKRFLKAIGITSLDFQDKNKK